ncbi:UNVERIFIED_CONTAM: hypothetical protein Scaly_2582400 [Sesamum calycinum]|uniref:Uncharacterized protein n=1 Tax=Sesamum calycinum TaxID=2727403 RepID=A0AAW2JFK7_9LAMI
MAEPISIAILIAPKVDLTGLPDKFSGQFFKRCQQRMKIWLTMKGLLTVIQVTRPEPTDTDPKTAEIAQWTERDQIGRGAILSALSNTLFDVYCSDSYTAKSLWDELDWKYNTEEQGPRKVITGKTVSMGNSSTAEETFLRLLRECQGEENSREELATSSQASVTLNKQQLWMSAAGGLKRGRVFGLGSKAHHTIVGPSQPNSSTTPTP